jgi:hypothetical protein
LDRSPWPHNYQRMATLDRCISPWNWSLFIICRLTFITW